MRLDIPQYVNEVEFRPLINVSYTRFDTEGYREWISSFGLDTSDAPFGTCRIRMSRGPVRVELLPIVDGGEVTDREDFMKVSNEQTRWLVSVTKDSDKNGMRESVLSTYFESFDELNSQIDSVHDVALESI